MTVEWCDPPPLRHSWHARLAEIVERPGEWACVGTYDSRDTARSLAVQLRAGRHPMPPGRFEFTSRTMPDGTGGVWARWLGE